jgi:hypothetical protein
MESLEFAVVLTSLVFGVHAPKKGPPGRRRGALLASRPQTGNRVSSAWATANKKDGELNDRATKVDLIQMLRYD